MFNIANYTTNKIEKISSLIIKEKLNLEFHEIVYKKSKPKKIIEDIKLVNQAVNNSFSYGITNNIIHYEDQLKKQQEKLDKLKIMLKFWIEEYSNLMTPSEFTEECVSIEINL